MIKVMCYKLLGLFFVSNKEFANASQFMIECLYDTWISLRLYLINEKNLQSEF